MPKTRPLCISTKWNIGDRVLGEAEKKSFIALPGKRGQCRLLPKKKKKQKKKLYFATQEDLVRIFIAMVQVWGC